MNEHINSRKYMTDMRKAAACEGKARYATFGEADHVAKAVTKHSKPVRPYKCGCCGQFHVGRPLARR